ncbi:MAG: hypothetical protein ACSHYB_10690 [Roseibacillus sp.]
MIRSFDGAAKTNNRGLQVHGTGSVNKMQNKTQHAKSDRAGGSEA